MPYQHDGLPHEGSGGAGAELCSLGTATGPEGTAWSWDGRVRLGGRFCTERVVGHWNRLPRAVVTALSLPQFKKHLDSTLRHMV